MQPQVVKQMFIPTSSRPLAKRLASPKLTVTVFLWLAAAALWIGEGGNQTLAVTPPLTLLLINLIAAILTHGRLRADLPLLVFHLALVALIILIVTARLTYLDGQLWVKRGATYTGQLLQSQRGPLHPDRLQATAFRNLGFSDEWPANGSGYLTFNRLSWLDSDGNELQTDIGDDTPLILNGYRFYATRRGFSPHLLWTTYEGALHYADIRLGSVEPDGWHAGYEWQLPQGEAIWLTLDHQVTHPPAGTRLDNLGVDAIDAPLVVRIADRRLELSPGDSVQLAGGRLTYQKLDVWMGYRVVYDPTTPWLIATCAVGIISLILFYAGRLFEKEKSEP